MKTILVILVTLVLLGVIAIAQPIRDLSKLSQPCHTNLHGVNPVGIVGLK